MFTCIALPKFHHLCELCSHIIKQYYLAIVIIFRIRTVPIKDGRYTPKLAVIKNELHPERTTVNVYIKYADEESVEKVSYCFKYICMNKVLPFLFHSI